MSRVFLEKDPQPTPELLYKHYGRAFACFEAIDKLFADCNREWKHYGNKYGWTYKITRKKKAQLYIAPYAKHLHVGLAVSAAERQRLLDAAFAPEVSAQLDNAAKLPEGYKLGFEIRTQKHVAQLKICSQCLAASQADCLSVLTTQAHDFGERTQCNASENHFRRRQHVTVANIMAQQLPRRSCY